MTTLVADPPLRTAVVVGNPVLSDGISNAFFIDGCLAIAGLLVVLFFVGGSFDRERLEEMVHYHRAHG